jgi:hypothetical protein
VKWARRVLGTRSLSILFVVALGLWETWPALTSNSVTIAAPHGDSLGAQFVVQAVSEIIREQGFKAFWSDTVTYPEKYGLGFIGTMPLSLFWKSMFLVLTPFFQPHQVHDICVFLSYVLIGIASLLVAWEVGLVPSVALLFALTVARLDFLSWKVYAHLYGLGFYFAVPLVLWLCLRFFRGPNASRFVVLGLGNWLNMLVNEYYGYFGLYMTASFVLVTMAVKYRTIRWTQIIFGAAGALIVFVVLMALCYPEHVASKLLGQVGSEPTGEYAARVFGERDISFWAFVTHAWFFKVHLSFWPLSLRVNVEPHTSEEICARFGLFLPILIVSGCLFLPWLYRTTKTPGSQRANPAVFAPRYLFIPLWTMFSVASPPEWKFSLARLTVRYAPMFRVGVRAVLYVEILLVLWAFLVFSRAMSYAPYSQEKCRRLNLPTVSLPWLQRLCICAFLVIGVWDTTSQNMLTPFMTHPIREAHGFSVVKREKGDGLLLQLPYYPTQDLDSVYEYYYHYLHHRKPFVNAWWGLRNDELYTRFLQFRERLDILTPEFLAKMGANGLEYLVINDSARSRLSWLKQNQSLMLLWSSKERDIYKIKGATRAPPSTFVERVISSGL